VQWLWCLKYVLYLTYSQSHQSAPGNAYTKYGPQEIQSNQCTFRMWRRPEITVDNPENIFASDFFFCHHRYVLYVWADTWLLVCRVFVRFIFVILLPVWLDVCVPVMCKSRRGVADPCYSAGHFLVFPRPLWSRYQLHVFFGFTVRVLFSLE
jgi:hypothetical protein